MWANQGFEAGADSRLLAPFMESWNALLSTRHAQLPFQNRPRSARVRISVVLHCDFSSSAVCPGVCVCVSLGARGTTHIGLEMALYLSTLRTLPTRSGPAPASRKAAGTASSPWQFRGCCATAHSAIFQVRVRAGVWASGLPGSFPCTRRKEGLVVTAKSWDSWALSSAPHGDFL